VKKFIFLSAIVFFLAGTHASAQHFWRGDLMPLAKIEKTWGESQFDKKKFRDGNASVKAAMAYDLIKSRIYIGKSRLDVVKELGPGDGYYFSGMIPAYIINDPPKKGDDVWQIVFLIDKDGAVTEVAVHKNCCDK
jgi:hypothetical protein